MLYPARSSSHTEYGGECAPSAWSRPLHSGALLPPVHLLPLLLRVHPLKLSRPGDRPATVSSPPCRQSPRNTVDERVCLENRESGRAGGRDEGEEGGAAGLRPNGVDTTRPQAAHAPFVHRAPLPLHRLLAAACNPTPLPPPLPHTVTLSRSKHPVPRLRA